MWQPPKQARPNSINLELKTGHSVPGRVIASDLPTALPFFFTPDGLEIVAHVFHAGCRRAMALDASGATGKMRRVGECGETWIAALDDTRGVVVEASGDRVVKAFGAPSGEPFTAEMTDRDDESAELQVVVGELRWQSDLGTFALLDGVAAAKSNQRAESTAAVLMQDGRLVTAPFQEVFDVFSARVEQWTRRVEWLSDERLQGRFSGGPREELIVTWLGEQLRAEGLNPTRQTFEIPRFTAETELRIDGRVVTEGYIALPTTEATRFRGSIRSSGDDSKPGPKYTVVDLPGSWTDLGKARGDEDRGPTFLRTDAFETYAGLDFSNAVWGDGPPALIISESLATRLTEADSVELNYAPTVQPVRTNSVVARVPGGRPNAPVIVVTAHWDHVGTGGFASLDSIATTRYPGANDNASGVASTIALAGRLRERPLEHYTVEFVFTAAEEQGLLGARAWVREHSRQPPALTINFDMMGARPRFFASENVPAAWADAIADSATFHGHALDEIGPIDEAGASDHVVIHDSLGSPAIFVHGMVEAAWHKDEDRVGSLNPDAALRATHIVESVLRTIDER